MHRRPFLLNREVNGLIFNPEQKPNPGDTESVKVQSVVETMLITTLAPTTPTTSWRHANVSQ